MGLFPKTAIIAGAMSFLEGDIKYRKYNWREGGVLASVYGDAADRHLAAWSNREDRDEKSGLPHLWKAIACLAILIDAEECGVLNDDRPPPAPVDAMLDSLQPVIKKMQRDIKASQYRMDEQNPPGAEARS